MKGSEHYRNVYTTSYSRAKFKYRNNGYFARWLDADDYAFLEHVKKCGIANGELPYTGDFLLEELGYWDAPYTIDNSVHRHIGRGHGAYKPLIIPDAEYAAIKARRIHQQNIAAAEKKALQEAWDHEQARLAREREERIKRQRRADLEWAAATPKRTHRSNGLPARHYVPAWKREEDFRKKQRAQDRIVKDAMNALARRQLEVQTATMMAEIAEREEITRIEQSVMQSERMRLRHAANRARAKELESPF